ncbi:MAG TPA: Hsp20/alpha crystallin family protein [Steroidobacteraceae bacterium]|nr:Hsp20/alpha crystallin family protein [Steroidobacteraceae bacterium]
MRPIDHLDWMWDQALRALESAERRQRRFCALSGLASAQLRWEPPADVFETESELLVSIVLPGIEPEGVTVEVIADGIVVSADRALPAEIATMRVRRLEIPYGRFERRIELARGRYALIERRMTAGCLTLRLVKE